MTGVVRKDWRRRKIVTATLILMLCAKLLITREFRRRRSGVRKLFMRRGSKGSYTVLVRELEAEDSSAFMNYFRIDRVTFEELLALVN